MNTGHEVSTVRQRHNGQSVYVLALPLSGFYGYSSRILLYAFIALRCVRSTYCYYLYA